MVNAWPLVCRCGELEEDLRAMVGRFVKMCWRRGLQIRASDCIRWGRGIGMWFLGRWDTIRACLGT